MKIGKTDAFEADYMTKFRQIAAPFGIFMDYETDRAGRDIGLHLTQASSSGEGRIVTPISVWFQMKGIMPQTLSLKDLNASEQVTVALQTNHLAFWYMNPQPTYLAIYVGSAELFLAIDIKDWVGENFGDRILAHAPKTVAVSVSKRNLLDEQFFRNVLNRNLVPTLRSIFSREKDEGIARFLRDSSLVKWLFNCETSGSQARIRVVSYMSKMRTEVYFESSTAGAEWVEMRAHWQFAMSDLASSFPFLTFRPQRTAAWQSETEYGWDSEPHVVRRLRIDEPDDGEWWDEDEDTDPECLFDLGDGSMSYGQMAGGEIISHEIAISLNEVGNRWATILKTLETSEIISVTAEPHFLSVAPWHAR
ncbi:DUF4365 domain-containing protein [Rhizobium laguerreae]|uniref:hypothetical protein n=1 Tax=Rhizobium laguerreae TaxID=1076926 RepID=UPI001A8F2AB1|nr:hypothetical protein [Rhizobium laguerreae]MBN9987224.1 DUF4365 domain-containing protein [Rhizobium laguerreae]MBY3150681.1 DUF4365 domain-containing protein [Rhizobium laguerreae]MBY3279494.1 DUF4365 domain-containing protein [Rhizobium laguerreae]MBY3475236.1 DUF4365 domain-containing protein [Rhizobium laguerreae]MBY3529476.1 DUF4365 domain-containing protein [Rhizobium laguerreae]